MSRRGIFGLGALEGQGMRQPRHLERAEAWSEAILPADAEAQAPEGETNTRPLMALGALILLVVSLLVFRLASLQLLDGGRNLALANGNRTRETVTRAPRGNVIDRHGVMLAQNQASYDIVVIPQRLPEDEAARENTYREVASLLQMTPGKVRAAADPACSIEKGDCPNPLLPRLVAESVPREAALQIDAAGARMPGFLLDVNPIRAYNDEGLLGPVLGYTGRISAEELKENPGYRPTDLIGKLGLELQYESELRGRDGGEQIEVDAAGSPIRTISSRPATSGNNLVLSIDQGLEKKMAESIRAQMESAGAERAAGVALDPRTGEVLAAVSLPSYDNNLFAGGISQEDYSRLTSDPGQPLFNKVTSGRYPSGSIIKPLVAAAALQEGVVTPQTTIEDKGYIDVANENDPNAPKQRFRTYEEGNLGVLNLTRALALSSNVYFYTIGGGFGNIKGLGVERLASYYQRFGLGEKTGIDLPSESAGRVPDRVWKKEALGESWYKGDTYNMSVGQGNLLVTPLQMAVSTAVIANGGKVMKPHLVRQVTDPQGAVVREIKPEVVRQDFIAPQHLQTVRHAMREVVRTGTAAGRFDQEVPVKVAGKTGSAESGGPKSHSWFSAFAPYEDPQIVVVVLVERAGGGARFAGPAVRETLSWYFRDGEGKNR